MSLRINAEAPNFEAETTQGLINFHDWVGDGWAILFSHPRDFTPVCTTELAYMARLHPLFEARGTKVIALSIDPLSSHHQWVKEIEATHGHAVRYPLIADPELKIARLYDMVGEDAPGGHGGRSPTDYATVRSVFIIGPDKRIKASLSYPVTTGRNFDEVLRLLDSCQLAARYDVATPANWRHGEDVIILPEVPDDDAQQKFPQGWRSPRPYIRLVQDPSFGVDCFETLQRR